MNAPEPRAEAVGGAHGALMRRATYASVAVALTLIVAKFVAWLYTDSVAMLATLVDSMLDAAASLVNLLAVRHALQPADREHRFGHGKAEPLAGLAQAAFIAGSAVFLFVEAGRRLFEPEAIAHGELGLTVMALSVALTLVLVLFQHHVVRVTGSLAIRADSLHYAGDLLANMTAALALVLSAWFGWLWADPILGAAIAVYIVASAGAIVRQSLDQLMDREFPDEERRRIRGIVLGHAEVRAVHDLRTRASGRTTFIQFHIEMDPAMTLLRAHEVSDEVEARVRAAYPGAEVLIHQDPEGLEEPPRFH
ncbi:MAG: cation diffusion facilitator family transporter [Alphaproteobacteria bacterium]|nr:cation diffusion facilitator family transporter [Alphaproteobacteria bacterium]